MSISPPSDILLDSLRGVDPAVRNASVEKLRKFSQTIITPVNGEPSFKSQVAKAQVNGLPFHAHSALTDMRNDALIRQTPRTSAKTAMQQFEGAFIKNFIETMQPTKTSSLYGTGTAGSVWQSFMADAVSKKISEAGGVGIAKSIESRFTTESPAAVPVSTSPPSLVADLKSPAVTTEQQSPEPSFFDGFRDFFSTIHGFFNSLLPASANAARRDEFSLTLR